MGRLTISQPLSRPAAEIGARITALPAARPVDVSILIVTWNSEAWIERCLSAVPAACGSRAWEVIVYDNASADRSREAVERAPIHPVELITGRRNSGFAAGMNQAIARAHGRYLFFLNPDCELSPGAVETLVNYLDDQSSVAAVAPLLLSEDGRVQREFQLRRFPSLKSLATDLLMVDELFPGNPASSHYRYRDLDITRPQPVEQPAAAALMVRRSACESVGRFDERFFPAWFEDVDYCRRLWQAGYPIHVNPHAVATHHGGASLAHVRLEQFLSAWYRNLHHYAEKWFSPERTELLRWLIMVGMVLRMGALALGFSKVPNRRGAISAHFRVLKEAFHQWDASRSS